MTASRPVAVVLYPGVVALDVVGPFEVFALAAFLTEHTTGTAAYAPVLVAQAAGPVRAASGILLHAERAMGDLSTLHTIVVPGGWVVGPTPLHPPELVAAVGALAARSERVVGVCTGAFALAKAGLLSGCRATTHWASVDALAAQFPDIVVDRDAIYVEHGRVWTSAGVTAGIDLALALVERDCGVDIARQVARELVVFLRRPGGQSQFSTHMRHPVGSDARITTVQARVADTLHADLRVEVLAGWAGMSPRNFARVFRSETGITPARFVERCRVEAVRNALESTDAPVESLADRFGFGTPEHLRRSFVRAHGVPPQTYRGRFGSAAAASATAASQSTSSRGPR